MAVNEWILASLVAYDVCCSINDKDKDPTDNKYEKPIQ